jgi:hypothetical protein
MLKEQEAVKMEFVMVMFWAILCMALSCFVGDMLGRIIAPPINAWVKRQTETEEEKEAPML